MARSRRAKRGRGRSRGTTHHRPGGTRAEGGAGRRPPDPPAAAPRIAIVDWLRGAALVGMTVFHFAYDLEFFGIEARGYADQPHWRHLATTVAGSFLFFAGASLVLAHPRDIRWPRWGRRLATVALAALAISVVTWFVTPKSWIFFGILHMIAVASVVGLAFVRAPWWGPAVAAVAVLAIDRAVHGALPDATAWYWIGLSSDTPVTSDFRPVFPWLAPVLLGVAAAKWCARGGLLEVLARPRLDGRAGRLLRFIGRNSLVYYLLHQPVLFALFWAWLRLAGR